MSRKRLDDLADFLRNGVWVICRNCRHHRALDPRALMTVCAERGWSRQIEAIERRCRCTRCGRSGARCIAGLPPTD